MAVQDATSGPAAGAAQRDWAQIIRTRLAGSTPRHEVSQWLVPGMFEPISAAQRRLLPQAVLPFWDIERSIRTA